jgi:orotate phosphoribosyltransferase
LAAFLANSGDAIPVKDRFLELLLRAEVLRFGSFQTKSGRQSPFFFNTGRLDSGERLGEACTVYAELIAERFGDRVENLFGPSYKGIPLAVMTAERLARRLGRDVSFTFNRKEAKDHGEGGVLVGRSYAGGEKVVVVEDVITGGTSIGETMPLLRKAGVEVLGVVVGIDRQERGAGADAARREVERTWGVPVHAIITLDDIVERLYDRTVLGKVWIDAPMKDRIDAYVAQYGAR